MTRLETRFETRFWFVSVVLLFVLHAVAFGQVDPELDRRLDEAGSNRSQIEKALRGAADVDVACRDGMRHLVVNMPMRDLRRLTAEFLLENVRLAVEAKKTAPWADRVDSDLFLDAVLPYANVDEPRHPWRAELREKFLPIVRDCKTPGEAARRLNETVFSTLGVKYSTKRRRANQSPKESIEQGLASCTGLSILLVDACRAVGIPARLVGVANWRKKRGNHTWVEVWDDGWHFTGAAEPSAKGLNDVWFAADVAHAVSGSERYGVWAATWRRTEHRFPMAWSPEVDDVFAVEVTDRYVPKSRSVTPTNAKRLLVRVRNESGERVAVRVRLVRVGAVNERRGTSRDESADTNDILAFELSKEETNVVGSGAASSYRIYAESGGRCAVSTWRPGDDEQEIVELTLPAAPATFHGKSNAKFHDWFTSAFAAMSRADDLPSEDEYLRGFLATEADDAAVRAIAWEAYRESPLVTKLREDFDAKRVTSGKHTSPYTVKSVGERASEGRALVIALHGGGGVAKEFNDRQWRHMQIYYKDHPEAGGYTYVALRAPNDTWNGFYDDYVYPLVERLIIQFSLFGDVDPNRVHVIGYSHGGYGVFSIAPKIADRFAAAHASAAAPTDGQTSARSLRNLPFSFMIGEKDTAYGRANRCRRFEKTLAELRRSTRNGWPAVFQWEPKFGHGGLPDRDHLPRLLLHRRDPRPTKIDWELTDGVVARHFWSATSSPGKGRSIRASWNGNRVRVESTEMTNLRLGLDARTIDFRKPVVVEHDGKEQSFDVASSLAVLARTMHERGDVHLAATAEITVIGKTTSEASSSSRDDKEVAKAIDRYLDRRFESDEAAETENLLAVLAKHDIGVDEIEPYLRAPRAGYPKAPATGEILRDLPLACDHVDYETTYHLYVPTTYDVAKAHPLVLVGHGGNGAMSRRRASRTALMYLQHWQDAAEKKGMVVAAPASARGWGAYGNSVLVSLISKLKREMNVDSDRIYATGQSMGGHMSWRCGIAFPSRFGAVGPQSGGYDYVEKKQVYNLFNIPGYATFGKREPYGIADFNRKIKAWMDERAFPWKIVEKNGGHAIYRDEIDKQFDFFLAHPRNLYRDRVYVRVGGRLRYDRKEKFRQGWDKDHEWNADRPVWRDIVHWVQLFPGEGAPTQLAWVCRTGPQRIEIVAKDTPRMRLLLHPKMVDLTKRIELVVNGRRRKVKARVEMKSMLERIRRFDDRGRIFPASVDVEIPTSAEVPVPTYVRSNAENGTAK